MQQNHTNGLKITFTKEDTLIIKAVSVLLMFFHHLFAQPDRLENGITYIPLFYIGTEAVETYIGIFGKLCVALFLFLGGYGTFLSCKESSSRGGEGPR